MKYAYTKIHIDDLDDSYRYYCIIDSFSTFNTTYVRAMQYYWILRYELHTFFEDIDFIQIITFIVQ